MPHGSRRTFTGFDELASLLARPLAAPPPGALDSLPGWSPAVFVGDYRRADRIERVCALGIDIDTGALAPERIAELYADRRAIAHTTRRSTTSVSSCGSPKGRAPNARDVEDRRGSPAVRGESPAVRRISPDPDKKSC